MTNPSTRRGWAAPTVAAILMMLAAAIAAPAQNYSVLYAFQGGTDGSSPEAGVIVDGAGSLYGTTVFGGTSKYGTVFKVDSTGNETVLYTFTGGGDGGNPFGGLILDSAGNLYGTAEESDFGIGCGAVFRIDAAGNETTLYSFTGDGCIPEAGLIRDGAGNLYGTTAGGGDHGLGTVFKLSPTGALTILYSFAGYPTDGESPFAPVVPDSAGNLYGTTMLGGTYDAGTVFEIARGGGERFAYSFTGLSGQTPVAPVVRDATGNLYGEAEIGGAFGGGVVFKLDPATGKETTLYGFRGKSDGATPIGGLIRDTAGNLYGTAGDGGNLSDCSGAGCGVIFRLNSAGKESVLYTFSGGKDGGGPVSNLLLYKGSFYGTASIGGNITGACAPRGCGVVFRLSAH